MVESRERLPLNFAELDISGTARTPKSDDLARLPMRNPVIESDRAVFGKRAAKAHFYRLLRKPERRIALVI